MLHSARAPSRAFSDRIALAGYGALAAGVIAGFGFGVAVTMSLTPPVEAAPPVARLCEFPAEVPEVAPRDGIGFRILLDAAKRRGAAGHA